MIFSDGNNPLEEVHNQQLRPSLCMTSICHLSCCTSGHHQLTCSLLAWFAWHRDSLLEPLLSAGMRLADRYSCQRKCVNGTKKACTCPLSPRDAPPLSFRLNQRVCLVTYGNISGAHSLCFLISMNLAIKKAQMQYNAHLIRLGATYLSWREVFVCTIRNILYSPEERVARSLHCKCSCLTSWVWLLQKPKHETRTGASNWQSDSADTLF